MKLKKTYIIAGVILTILVVSLVLIHKAFSGKNIYISSGFDRSVMIKVDHTETKLSEVVVHISSIAAEYENLFGTSVWEDEMDGVPFEDYIINEVKTKLTRMKCMDQVAITRGIVLSNQEEANIKKAASEYLAGVDKESIRKYNLSQSEVEEMYRSMLLADKLYQYMTENVDREFSEDDARVISIQYIKTDSLGAAQLIEERIKAGTSFSSLIKENNPYEYEYELRRGETEEAFETAAYRLATGEVSAPVECSDGVYIILCVNDYDKAKTTENKQRMIDEYKLANFNAVFDEYEAGVYAEYNEKLWDSLDSTSRLTVTTDFQGIYDRYFATTTVEE